MDLEGPAARVGPILGFVVCITVVAELASGIGVFAMVARGASRLARGSVLVLWLLVVLVAVVQYGHDHGLGALLGAAAGTGESWTALLRMAGLAALGANLVDNLPSYLALEPTAQDSPLRLAGLLVGVNAGPLVTPWASLATLLWAARCRSAGVSVSWGRFALRGLLLVPLLLVTAVTALWLAHR
ncbi:MAG: ArsB/NhaD family transporter [Friedmanniella sp.]